VEITDVKLRKINSEGPMKAIVSVIFDNEFVVRDIKVIDGEKGLFVAMPSKRTGEREFRDIAHPIDSAAREKIHRAILEKYETTPIYEKEATLESDQ